VQKKDWLFSVVYSVVLIIMIASNLWLITLFLSMQTLLILMYVTSMIIVLYALTQFHFHNTRLDDISKKNWIKNHLLFWIMTDLHTLIIIFRYIFPNERQGGFYPELLFFIHLLLIYPVFVSYKFKFYDRHKIILNFFLHIIIYGFLSYSFIQLIIQTMQ
jgi:hypothetical protein